MSTTAVPISIRLVRAPGCMWCVFFGNRVDRRPDEAKQNPGELAVRAREPGSCCTSVQATLVDTATIRREQVREAIARNRKRRKHGLLWRPILVTKSQLDQLEERGYLDPNRRGERLDECEDRKSVV